MQCYNGMGSRSGKKGKVTGCQLAFATDDPTMRFGHEDIELFALFEAAVGGDYGMARPLAGVDEKGIKREYGTFSDELKRLDQGVEMMIPDDVRGGMMMVRVFFWVLCASCDFPAAASLLPYTLSVKTKKCCRQCDWDQAHPHAHRPHSFFHANGRWKLRNWDVLRAALDSTFYDTIDAADALDAAAADALAGLDVVRTSFVCQDKHIPGFIPTKDAPQDALHALNDGVLNFDFACVRVILKHIFGIDASALNWCVKIYKDWPADARIPPFVDNTSHAAYGLPKSDASCKMSGAEMGHFALHRCTKTLEPSLTFLSCCLK
jgi:hypothetical protein